MSRSWLRQAGIVLVVIIVCIIGIRGVRSHHWGDANGKFAVMFPFIQFVVRKTTIDQQPSKVL
jgi:hypothetical protein